MFNEDDEEAPASVVMKTESGGIYDLNNISGAAKTKLIMEGELSIEDFTTPDNMPGKKLAELRASKGADIENGIAAHTPSGREKNTYEIGDVIRFKNYISEILELDPKRGVKIKKSDGKLSKWIHHSKIELHNPGGD